MRAHLVAGSAYAAFVLIVAGTMLAEWRLKRSPPLLLRSRELTLLAARTMLVLVVVGTSLLSVTVRANLWPFSNWALMTGAPQRDMSVKSVHLRLAVVDAEGNEQRVDHRAVEPFAFEELMAWMRQAFVTLPPEAQDSAARYLLDRINVARARVRAGESPSAQARWVGPLRAPYHLLHPHRWTAPEDVPAEPFRALRVYSETWDVLDRARDPSAFEERVIFEFRPETP